MPIYTFYLCREDGTSPYFEMHEHADNLEAAAKAAALLDEHPSCVYIALWAEDLFVENRCRDHARVGIIRHFDSAGERSSAP